MLIIENYRKFLEILDDLQNFKKEDFIHIKDSYFVNDYNVLEKYGLNLKIFPDRIKYSCTDYTIVRTVRDTLFMKKLKSFLIIDNRDETILTKEIKKIGYTNINDITEEVEFYLKLKEIIP